MKGGSRIQTRRRKLTGACLRQPQDQPLATRSIHDDKVIELKPKEYDLLVYLCQHRGQLLSRQRILTDVWGWEYYGNSRTVDIHVRWLRERLEEDPQTPNELSPSAADIASMDAIFTY